MSYRPNALDGPMVFMVSALCVLAYSCSASAQNHAISKIEYEIYELILLQITPFDEFDRFLKSENPDYVMPRLKLLVFSTTENPFSSYEFSFRPERIVDTISDYKFGFRPEGVADSIPVEASEQMSNDLQMKASAKSTIEDRFSALVPVRILSAAEIDSIAGDEAYAFWEEMHENFGPCAIVHFSRVGFDKTGKYGVLYYSYSSGGLSGAGFRVIVRRTQDAWKIHSACWIWIS